MILHDRTQPGGSFWGQKSQVIYPDGVDASQHTPEVLPPE